MSKNLLALWLSCNFLRNRIFRKPCNLPCSSSMNFRPLRHTLDLAKVGIHEYQFWAVRISLRTCFIYLVDQNLMIFADNKYQITSFNWSSGSTWANWQLRSQISLMTKRACILSFFRPFRHSNYIKDIQLVDLIMPKPVYLLPVHEAHKVYKSLIEHDPGQVRAIRFKMWVNYQPAFPAEMLWIGTSNGLNIVLPGSSNVTFIWTCQCPSSGNSSIEVALSFEIKRPLCRLSFAALFP